MQDDEQERVNEDVWSRGGFVREYATRELRPVEATLLDRHRHALIGRVLELGCGAGRLTGHLIELGGEVHGVDLAPAMVAYCRRTYPRASFSEGDLRDLSHLSDHSYDAVFAPFNVLDVLGDPERRRVLSEIRRIVTGDGLFVFSSHNRGYTPRVNMMLRLYVGSPRRPLESLKLLPTRLRNRRRLRPREREEAGYALVNDEAHEFSVLHYYISRDAQAQQLAEQGFELREALDLAGQDLPRGSVAPHCPEIHYVARPLS